MTRFASATDLAITNALRDGTLVVTEMPSRFGDTYFALSDDHGLIEVQPTRAEADARLAACAKITAKISFDGYRYYISYLGRGTRSRKDYKTEAGARRIAISKGEVVDPTPAAYVLPIYLDPTSETYMSA